MSDTTPFDFFRQEASHADLTVRAEAMNRMVIIVSLMTPEKARTEMLPFLQTKMDDMDQVLLCLARRIGDVVPYVGGPAQAKFLIPLLEELLNTEETQVRSAAAQSVNRILKTLGPEHKAVTREYLELFQRLVIDDGGEVFYGRVSACEIASQLHLTLTDSNDKQLVREAFTKLSVDELSIVRRATLGHILALGTHADAEVRTVDLLGILKQLTNDEASSVKILAVELLPSYCELLYEMKEHDVISSEIQPLIKLACEDPSWKVKCAISKQYGLFAKLLPQESQQQLFRSGITLMSDDEPEVRQLIVSQIFPYCQPVGLDPFLSALVPLLQLLYDDPVPDVRKGVAELAVDAAIACGSEGMANHLADIVLKLLADEDGLVRLRVLGKLSRVAEDVPNLLTRVTPSIKLLYTDSNWRVRRAIAYAMPSVMGAMGPEYFQNHFLQEYLQLLKDGVSEVRVAMGETFPRMVECSTTEWFLAHVFSVVRSLVKDEYLVRLSIIGGLREILRAHASLTDTNQSEVLMLIVGFTKDTVPNVRLRAAQALSSLFADPSTDVAKSQVIRTALTELQADRDKDVKYFASTAMLAK